MEYVASIDTADLSKNKDKERNCLSFLIAMVSVASA